MSEAGKVAKFDETGCQFLNSENKVIATAVRCGSLHFLNCRSREQASVAVTKEDVWHGRYGHLCGQNLRKLAVDGLVDGFDFDGSKQISFCESLCRGETSQEPFPCQWWYSCQGATGSSAH